MKLLLDTNAYSEMKRGDPRVAGLVRRATDLVLSSIVVGELLYGFRLGSRLEENVAELDDLLGRPYVELVAVTRETAERYARVAEALRRKGRPIPTNDIWIAAHALETGSHLATFDAHFEEVDGLVLHLLGTAPPRPPR